MRLIPRKRQLSKGRLYLSPHYGRAAGGPTAYHRYWSRLYMPVSADYDIAVIGAGPAGSRTAELLAAQGFRTLLLERDAVAGQPVHCTGIVSTECFQRYELPSSLIIRPVNSFVLRSPSGRGTHIHRNAVQAYILDRVALDGLLAQRAMEAGAELVLNTTVENIQWTGRGVDIHATREGHPWGVAARAAVVATGYGAPLARRLGLTTTTDVVSGCQAVVEASEVDEIEVFTGSAFGHGGYGWLVPWRSGYALAGLLTRKHAVRRMEGHLTRLRDCGRIGAVQDIFRCRPVPLGVTRTAVLDGILGVGDAVSQVKPTSGGGIYYGLLGADAAACVLARALRSGDTTASSLAPYDTEWRRLMEPEISQGYALRRVLEQLPEGMVESLHLLLSLPGLKGLAGASATFDWHSGPLTRVLGHLERQARAREATAP